MDKKPQKTWTAHEHATVIREYGNPRRSLGSLARELRVSIHQLNAFARQNGIVRDQRINPDPSPPLRDYYAARDYRMRYEAKRRHVATDGDHA